MNIFIFILACWSMVCAAGSSAAIWREAQTVGEFFVGLSFSAFFAAIYLLCVGSLYG